MPSDVQVPVKALEWKEYPEQGFWRADTPVGEYSVGFEDGWWAQLEGVDFWEWETPEDPRAYSGPEAGMLACKADFAARIRSALDGDALAKLIAEARAEGMERAADAVDVEWRRKIGLNCTEVCAIIRAEAATIRKGETGC